jgi:peptide/nickel transport system permease protein
MEELSPGVTQAIKNKKQLLKTLAMFRSIKRHKLFTISLTFIFFLIIIAIFAPFVAPYDPIEQNLKHRLSTPSSEHFLGTDQFGRDMLSRLIFGIKTSLTTGTMAALLSMIIGVFLGLVAGYFGGIIDDMIMRFTDIVLSFPSIVLTLAIAGALGPSLINIVFALVAVGWTQYTRVVRGSVLSLNKTDFIVAAKAVGLSDFRIIFRHILPNCTGPIIVMMTLGMGGKILSVAGLSFLGLGAQPPTAEWGMMLKQGIAFMDAAPHLTIFPGLVIMITVLAFNILGDGLRDIFDPQMRF